MNVSNFGIYLRQLREERELGINQLATISGVSNAQISRIEKGTRNVPKPETIKKLSKALKVPYEEMMKIAGYINDDHQPGELLKEDKQPYYVLTPKDEKDIAKELEKLKASLESDEALTFYNEPMDEETKRLMQISLENSLRLAKELAKKKFTPKKYRN
ncbi:helix-turn-helix transcriptional regulator [Paenibacillus thiaminolyticus]|uniref:helix-turn-helix domain-containing protein n=1 Tax=Paenibacillus thiaminolyticus TaxID=49283 RepID=UPI0011631469|nr:helix-turn-helix transcriptional regulator [Paenibacillus thiaminolyticus]NGP56813.1 helix-turn-helix transcriptional regulator [Paenibacillus thiaminolyticus]